MDLSPHYVENLITWDQYVAQSFVYQIDWLESSCEIIVGIFRRWLVAERQAAMIYTLALAREIH